MRRLGLGKYVGGAQGKNIGRPSGENYRNKNEGEKSKIVVRRS